MGTAALLNCLIVLLCRVSHGYNVGKNAAPFEPLCGILNVNKPRGITSSDACQIVKRIIRDGLRERYPTIDLPRIKVGHGGTLDMHAEGVLAIGVGRATKFLPFYLQGNKTYEATGVLGYETDTLDVHGERLKEAPCDHVTDAAFDAALHSMRGLYEQVPPIYSSKKCRGRRLRDYAAKKIPVEIKPCKVIVYSIERLSRPSKGLPHFALRVTTSGGTYVRSLIRDMAYKLNTLGTMESLIRVAKCNLSLADSLPVHSLDYDTIVRSLRNPTIEQ